MTTKKTKDFTVNAADTSPVIKEIATVTATPAPQEIPRKRRGENLTAEEIQLAREQGKTQGRKGFKATRINVAFYPANHEYLTTMSRVRGETITEFLNYIISESMVNNRELYERAKSFVEEFN